jgi:CheY-like chemotaxis protein
MHALIIEDEPLIAMLLEDILSDAGYTSFEQALDQRGAIQAAKRRCPDLITADDKLISGTGIGAVKVICAEQAIPVIFITGNPVSIDDAVALAKPFRPSDLIQAIPEAIAAARTYT